jgi:AraC family transcriptional regulator
LFLLPAGHRWSGTFSGSASARVLACDLDPSIFKSVLGDRTGFDLEPYFGESRIAPGILERLEALCLTPDAFPRAYADALTTVLTFELFRARSNKPFSPNQAQFGASRFKPVLDHIEGVLESDPSLSDLASLMGLSVSHFSHAFTAAYGVAPHRYILQRRIEKAKALLRTSDATVAMISERVGFSSQSRFSQIFARQTGITPSAYRMKQHNV